MNKGRIINNSLIKEEDKKKIKIIDGNSSNKKIPSIKRVTGAESFTGIEGYTDTKGSNNSKK